MEINQAGLSWDIVLQKYKGIKEAYAEFEVQKVAKFETKEITMLMKNPQIIRHELKIRSIVYNAQQILQIQKDRHRPIDLSCVLSTEIVHSSARDNQISR